jgi:hypothetical protein
MTSPDSNRSHCDPGTTPWKAAHLLGKIAGREVSAMAKKAKADDAAWTGPIAKTNDVEVFLKLGDQVLANVEETGNEAAAVAALSKATGESADTLEKAARAARLFGGEANARARAALIKLGTRGRPNGDPLLTRNDIGQELRRNDTAKILYWLERRTEVGSITDDLEIERKGADDVPTLTKQGDPKIKAPKDIQDGIDKTHDDTARPPTAFDPRAGGRGALGPDTTTAVVGFEVGRLLNELRFHLVQAWVCTEGQREHVVRIALELGRVARFLRRTATSRERIQNEVRTTVDRLLESCREEWHAESISHLIDVHNNPSTVVPPDEEVQAEEVRRSERESFWERVHSEIERLRGSLTRNLDERARLALHLGELIDQWVRRKDVQDFLLTESDDVIKKDRRIRTPRHERYYVINELTAGSMPGDPRWAGDVMVE